MLVSLDAEIEDDDDARTECNRQCSKEMHSHFVSHHRCFVKLSMWGFLLQRTKSDLLHRARRLSDTCGWEVIYPVLGPIPNGAGTMVLRVVFLFLYSAWLKLASQ